MDPFLLTYQDHVGVSNSAPADCPLHALLLPGLDEPQTLGKPVDEPLAHIHDYIGTSKFRISPTAFFQVCLVSSSYLVYWKEPVFLVIGKT